MTSPTTAGERIESIDVLRGFALLGILLINMQAFALPAAAYFNPTAYGDLSGANYWAWAIPHVLADFKFVSIFSMLFGAGIVLMAQRADNRGESAAWLHYRRMGWLILFGFLHAHFLWFGDILFSYGVTGLVVFLFRNLRPRILLILALILGLIPSVLLLLVGLTIPFWPGVVLQSFDEEGLNPNQEVLQEELTAYRGSYLHQTPPRSLAAFANQLVVFPALISWRVASLMLLGMALLKLGALTGKWSRSRYLALATFGVCVGVPIITLGVYRNFQHNWDVRTLFFGFQYNYWGSYLVALGWIAGIMLWCRSGLVVAFRARLAALGRMALSNYILQTLICTTIFYGHGFGYFGSVERKYLVLLALLIYALQLAISPLWLRHYAVGPLEALWRRLTYGKRVAAAQ